jgi:hypothetical protein
VTVLRQPAWLRLLVAAIGLGCAAVLVVGGIDEGGWALLACLVGAVLVLAGTWRQDRMRVELGRDVVVVNFWRTVVLSWSEVDRFGYESGAWVRRRDMRQHEISLFSPPPGSFDFAERRCREAVRSMEAHRKRRGRR